MNYSRILNQFADNSSLFIQGNLNNWCSLLVYRAQHFGEAAATCIPFCIFNLLHVSSSEVCTFCHLQHNEQTRHK